MSPAKGFKPAIAACISLKWMSGLLASVARALLPSPPPSRLRCALSLQRGRLTPRPRGKVSWTFEGLKFLDRILV